jgi:hypothetical protein
MAGSIEKPNHPGAFTMPEIKHAFNAFDLDDNKYDGITCVRPFGTTVTTR